MLIELKEGLGFSAAHFVVGQGGCEHLHGHNWRVGVVVEGNPDERGLILDFVELRRIVRGLCDQWDHHLLLPEENPAVEKFEGGENVVIKVHGRRFELPREEVTWLPLVNTTVEELARVLAGKIADRVKRPNIRRLVVRVEESPGQGAEHEVRF